MMERLEPVPAGGLGTQKPIEDPPVVEEHNGANGANGKRLLVGTMDQMLVFNDPATQCQRSMKINGYLYSDDTPEEVNARADLARTVLERQFLMQDLQRMADQRESYIQGMTQHRDYLKELSKRKAARAAGDGKVKNLTASELKVLNEGEEKLLQTEKGLQELDKKIAATKAKCGITE